MSDNIPDSLMPLFDNDDQSDPFADDPADNKSVAGLNASALTQWGGASELIPDFDENEDVTGNFHNNEPEMEDGDTGTGLPVARKNAAPTPPSAPQASQGPVASAEDDTSPDTQEDESAFDSGINISMDELLAEALKAEEATAGDITPVYRSSDEDSEKTPEEPDETPTRKPDQPYYSPVVTPTMPMADAGKRDRVNLDEVELSTEPSPPEDEGHDSGDAPPSGPAGREDVVVRVFFPRPPGEEPADQSPAPASKPSPSATYRASADEPPPTPTFKPAPSPESEPVSGAIVQEPDTDDLADTRPHPTVDPSDGTEDETLAETRPHPRPEDEPQLAAPVEPTAHSDDPLIDWEPPSDWTVSDEGSQTVQETLRRGEEGGSGGGSEPPVVLASDKKPRRRGMLIWMVVGTTAAVLLIAAGLGLWGVLGDSLLGSIAGLFGSDSATPTPESGVIIEPTGTAEEMESMAPSDVTPTPRPDAAPTEEPDAVLTDEGLIQLGIPMVFVPGGSFEMGTDAQAHRVTLSPYYIDRYEVTNAAYAACVEDGDCTEPESLENYAGDLYYGAPAFLEHPVINVTWEQANAYCEWRGARLPTEAEWEMAARVNPDTGVQTVYPWGSDWDPSRLNYCDASCALAANVDASYNDTWPQTARVGSFPSGASGVGAQDMAGNVSEWVADWYGPNYYLTSPEQDPLGPETGEDRVIRGGAWGVSTPDLFLSAARTHFDPTTSGAGTGFRCSTYAADIEGLPLDESQEDT